VSRSSRHISAIALEPFVLVRDFALPGNGQTEIDPEQQMTSKIHFCLDTLAAILDQPASPDGLPPKLSAYRPRPIAVREPTKNGRL
jgi:hypothetical protein